MALGLAAKKEIVAEINDVASRALSVAVAEYRGMEVAELTDLRVKAREQGVYLRVVRNTLAKRALADSKFADLDSALTGPLIYGLSIDAPGGAARLLGGVAVRLGAWRVAERVAARNVRAVAEERRQS